MLNNHKKDLTGDALKSMTNYIHLQIEYLTPEKIGHWVECVK
jgi:hypothetical protein